MKLIEDKEQSLVHSYKENIGLDIASTLGDLRYLLNQHELSNLLDRDYAKIEDLENDFLHFSKEKAIYDQIRILDRDGQERVRINYNNGKPAIVSTKKLQNKLSRYYFQDTYNLERGAIFISPLDLNIENGAIEQPLKPMIRIGMPIFDKNGEKQGIILLNYLANQVLESFNQMSQRALGINMLLNQQGYWLKGENEDDAWGFMYKDRIARTFQNKYPEEWEQIIGKNSGQFRSENGLFTFETVRPLQSHSSINSTNIEYCWTIISRVTPGIIQEQSKAERQTLLLAFVTLTLLLLTLSIVKSRSVIAEQLAQESIRQKNQSLQSKQEELETALSEVTQSNVTLNETIGQLENALVEIKSLKGILPICSYCKEIRDDEGYWIKLEKYIQTNSEAEFSHSICDKCLEEKFPECDDDDDD